MIARCARCQGTFTTDRFGLQTCPHCGSELLLQDPNAPAGAAEGAPPPPPPEGPPAGAPPAQGATGGGALPPAPPPPGGWGPPPGGWPPPPPGGWGRPPPAPPPAEAAAPFAERKQRGLLASFFETWKLVALQPQDFFRRVRVDQTGSAVLFGVIASTVGSVVSGLFSLATGEQTRLAAERFFEGMPPEQLEAAHRALEHLPQIVLASIVVTPILAAVGIYVVAAVLHLLLTLFRGAGRGFDATLTVVAYAAGLGLLSAIPTCGAVLAAVWWVIVLVAGLGEAQRCGQGKAAAAVLAPAALACICCCVAPVGLSLPALLKGIGEATGQGTVKL